MPRSVIVPRLGIGGRNTDKPTWAVRPDELIDGSQDGHIWEGAMRSRRGFKLQHTVTGFYANHQLQSIYRASFRLTANSRSYASVLVSSGGALSGGALMLDLGTNSAATSLNRAGGYPVLPRAIYNDQLLCCSQDGYEPMMLLTGIDPLNSSSSSGAGTSVAGRSTLTTAGPSGTKGQYADMVRATVGTAYPPNSYIRVIEAATSTLITLDGFKATAAVSFQSAAFGNLAGVTYPCIVVYNEGTISTVLGTSVATGVGTKWRDAFTNDYPVVGFGHGCLFTGQGNVGHYQTYMASSLPFTDTSMYVYAPTLNDQRYAITARCPFKDVCVHNETLYGVGVAQYPSRVYVAPAGWNMAYPPGAILPYDHSTVFASQNTGDFLLDFIDVPNPNDSDPIVAILATDGPRLVLKQDSIYGIYGEPPSLSSRLIHAGDGCIDIRSAISTTEGAFWAGGDGIYRYRFGRFDALTDGWMRNEWRALTNVGIEYCTMGIDAQKLIVSIKTADAAQQRRTYIYDLELERWLPELSNLYPRYIFNVNIANEIQQTLCVADAYPGKVINVAPSYNDSGPSRDELGTGPSFKLLTGDVFTQADGIEGEVRTAEASVHAVVQDAAGTTTLNVKMVHGGSLSKTVEGQGVPYDTGVLWDASGAFWGPDGCKSLGDITNTIHAEVVRNEFAVNRTGRRARLQVEQTTTTSTAGVVEVGEVVVRNKDKRRAS